MTLEQNLNDDKSSPYKFELFFELSPDLLCIAGFDGYFKKINPAVSKLLGFTNEELLSKPINEFVYHEDQHVTEKARDGIRKNNPLLHFENRYVTKTGEIVWLHWTSMPIYDDNLVFAIAKNITHKKKLEEERNLLLANLTVVNNDLKQLTYTTSHDLRAPVNNLLSIFSLMDVSKIEDDETLLFINILKSASEGLRKTLNDYVDILSQKGRMDENMEELDINEVLNSVRHSIKFLIENSKTTFITDFSAFEKITYNRACLESIFLNLITNSIKYAKPDCSPIISIYSHTFKGINQLVIADNGMGFDMDNVKDKIFGLHQKFHNHIDSKGIGLYLVHNHITSLGGRIEVESKINEGAKFIITFRN